MLGVLRAAIPGTAFAQTWPTLVSLWTFDETSAAGGVFADSGPANVPMSIVGTWADLSTASMVQGVAGTSAYTDGSGHATIAADDPEHDLSELTISFYYQRNSAAAKHILLAAGDGTQAGDFSIEVLANGRLRGYHVGQDAVLRFFESGSGITGTDLQLGSAHRIDLTLGSLGARIYLDGAPLISAFILANTNGWNNTRIKYLGIFPQVELGGQADGAFDGLRIWDRQLTAQQIATLEPAQSVTLPGDGAINVGALSAFTRSVKDVTALAGWPVGRMPKAVLQQGDHCSAFIRRAWKPSNNSGNFIDFIPGWQKTTSAETIRLQLDNNSEIDLTYTVGHTIPAPTGSGVTRTLDRTGGGNFTTWASAIAALTSGDVLVVRAPPGTWTDPGGHAIPNYVYDVTTNPVPPSGVNNVAIVAHPDDVAAGRRPIIWRNAGLYARFKYAAASAWQVHANLGGSHGSVYESVATSTQPNHGYFGAVRDLNGDWLGLYPYQAISDGTDRSPTMHDTTYGPTSMVTLSPPTYFGPGILYNKGTDKWEVRLLPPQQKSYQNPAAGLPWPPWNWTAHYPPSNDARQCEIVITDGAGFSNGNCLLDINGRNGWKFYNLDFVYGNFGVKAEGCSTQPQFFGCSFLGGAPTSFNNDGENISHTSSAVLTFNTSAAPSTDLVFDRCSIHGAMMPWTSFGEGKGFRGAFGIGARRDFISWSHGRALFRYCKIRHWWQFWWLGNSSSPHKCHFHHSLMYQFGMDGGLLGENTNDADAFVVNRCFMPSAQMYGFTSADDGSKQRHMSFCVDLRLSTLGCGVPNRHKWGYNNAPDNVVAYVHCQSTAHASGARSNHQERKFFNTCVGSQNTNPIELSDSSEGCGSGMGPDSRGANHRIFNCIGAVYPSPVAWPPGRSNFVVFYTTEGGNSQCNHNLLFKSAGMLASGAGSSTFAKANAGSGAGTAYADIAALRSGTGFEVNGVEANPQFVVTPAWATSNPYAEGGAFDLGNYMLGASSPARTGGRNLNDQSFPDYDFETLSTFAGGNNCLFRGALDPNIPLVEQEVGIVGPLPPEIA